MTPNDEPTTGSTATGEAAAKTKAELVRFGLWTTEAEIKPWHSAAIAALSLVDGNATGAEGDRAKLSFILAKNFDDGIDRLVAATAELATESRKTTVTMARLQKWMIGVTIVYVLVTAIGVYLSRQVPAPTIVVEPAPVQFIQPNPPALRTPEVSRGPGKAK